jgi:hypothetical protein
MLINNVKFVQGAQLFWIRLVLLVSHPAHQVKFQLLRDLVQILINNVKLAQEAQLF